VIPRWRGDRDREEAATRGPLVGPRKLRPLAKCFAASEFFEIVASMDSEFSLYAKTTLARARVAHFPAIRAMNGAWRGVSCSFSGCTREAVAVGLCDQHGNMHRRGEPLRPIGEARPRGIVACAFEGCGRRGSRRGLCVAHRKQQLKGNNLRPLKTPLPHGPCSFDACDKPRRSARGLCAAHARQHRMSESLRPLRFRMKGLDCEFTSCGRHAMRMGLCPAHAKQRAKGKDLTPIRTAANRRDLQ
jgi:hypothetical protein